MIKTYEFLKKDINFKSDDYVVAAISGGPDSMALLHIMIDLKNLIGFNLICAHVNHNLREESAEEKIFLENYCINNGVIFDYMKIEEYSSDNFHNQARTKRYDFFESLVKKYNAKYLLTAHHGDDLMETVLMRIVRGSTLRGYSGFSKRTSVNGYELLKPLIFYTKAEILQYVNDNEIEYRVDYSNSKDTYTRNRFRKYVLPFLKQEEKNVNLKFLKFSETLNMYNNYIDRVMLESFDKVYSNNEINIDYFKMLDELIQTRTLNYIFELIYDKDLNLVTDKNVMDILKLVTSTKPNKEVNLPKKYKAIKKYNTIKITDSFQSETYLINLENENLLPNGKKISKIEFSESDGNDICRINLKDVVLPLIIRTRKNGDTIILKGTGGTKKVKDIFIDEKISQSDRALWPILVDSNDKILWIPGLKKSHLNMPKNENCDIIIKYE